MIDELIAWLRPLLDAEQAELEQQLQDPLAGMSDDELHERHLHRAYEYRTLEGQRKAWRGVDDPPEGDGWELNTTAANPDAFERFDYTEERRWRRLRPGGPTKWQPPTEVVQQLGDVEIKRRIISSYEAAAAFAPAPDTPAAGAATALAEVVQLLALTYQGSDGFREEWRP